MVHNKEIMNNWVEELQKFLVINDEPPEYKTPTGRVKRRKSVIGTRYAGQEQKIFMQIGPVRYRFSAKDKVKLQGI